MMPIISPDFSPRLKPEIDISVKDVDDAALREAARDFETAFISQMLTFSGLGDALTIGGGEDVSAFASFYIESLAGKISDNGGFGLTEHFYKNLLSQKDKVSGDTYVNTRKL